MTYLQIRNLSKAFESDGKQIHALDRIRFTVEQGEFVSILGPSGCGKTTLLRSIAGLEPVSSGEVILNERRVTQPGPELGVVFQEHRLFPWLTVRDNVEYGLARQGIAEKQRHKQSDYYLEMVGLSEFAANYPKELSIGMSQRVGIARALATDPDILLMDEPFASVDAQTRRELQRELLRIWRETNKTVLFVTHSVDEAILLSERVVILSSHPGRVDTILDVPLDYPRKDTDAEFNAIKREIHNTLLHDPA